MGGSSLPPGFRFHPTDEELVGYYLKRKVEGFEFELEVVPVIDLYKFDPWELPDKSFLPNRDLEWFFFCPRDRKYPNGSRTNRATKAGYWKATGKDRKVVCQSSVCGYRKTLVFYRGRAPLGDRTDWVMHEYRLCDDAAQGAQNFQGAFALCRVVKRNEQIQNTSDSQSSSKMAGSSNVEFSAMDISNDPVSISTDISSQGSFVYNNGHYSSPYEAAQRQTSEAYPMDINNSGSFMVSPDMILDSSKEYSQRQETTPDYFPQYEFPGPLTSWQQYDNAAISTSSSYSNFTAEFEPSDDFNQIGSMSSYSGQGNYMGHYGNEDMSYQAYDYNSSLGYPKPF